MSKEYKEFCSNPNCTYESIYSLIPGPDKFCTRCGQPTIIKCPKCNKEFPIKTETYCPECGTKIKNVD